MESGHKKRKSSQIGNTEEAKVELFVDAPPDADSDGASDDSTDSEDSEYSGLEEEEDSSADEGDEESDQPQSFDEGSSDESMSEDEKNTSTQAKNNKNDNSSDDEEVVKKKSSATKSKPGTKFGKQKASKKKESKNKDENANTEKATSSKPESVLDNDPGGLQNEYEFDSSDEEDIRNTVGNIPMEWYKQYEHLGYDLDGNKILKPKSGDQLDNFLDKMENPNYWRTVQDRMTGQNVVLSDQDVEMIRRMKASKYVDPSLEQYAPWVDFFTHETMIHPVTNRPEHKRSFIPSLWEKRQVGRFVHAIKMGWLKPRKPDEEKKAEEEEERFYELWKDEDQTAISKRLAQHIPAPKMALPGHSESYNPPPEYLMTEEEELAWKEQDPEDRKQNFVPKKFSCLRHVPAYTRFINERFERCLDLYLCPRQRKMRMNVNPEDLIPKLPKPKDLQPFPTVQAIVYKGHTGIVRSISIEPLGQWFVSGSDDGTVRFWEVSTGRCMKTLQVGGVVKHVTWNPNQRFCLVAIAVEDNVMLVNPGLGDKLVINNTDNMITSYESQDVAESKVPVTWETAEGSKHEEGIRLLLKHPHTVNQVTWHAQGDYLAAVTARGDSNSVVIHQVSKRRSQAPFRKPKGLVQCVKFHPTRPFLLVATQRYVRVYNLLKQELAKKLLTNCKWVSSLAVHPGGDNVIIGSYDCRLSWFDLDLSTKPYQTLRHHKKAIRHVAYHRTYPLFASASDDGTVIVCHGKVFNDLLQNPLIVPVKILRGHTATKDLGVLSCEFHPTQPWVFTSGSDATIRLFS